MDRLSVLHISKPSLKTRIAKAAVRAAAKMTVKRDRLVVRSAPDFEDSTRNLIRAASDAGLATTVLCSSLPDRSTRSRYPANTDFRSLYSISGFFGYATARYVAFTHGVYGSPRPVKSQIICNLWHGMPLKTTAAGAGDTPPEFDFTIATSERFALILEQSFQVGRESVELVGLPRNDSLKVGNDSPSKFIVMMPTWRTSIYGTTNIHAGDPGAWAMDKEQVGELNGVLHAHGYKALIKPHPMSDPLELSHWESEHISVIDNRWLLDRDISLYELISDSALLVTDYSSIAVDYVITGRPICLLQSDLSDYQATRGLNFSYDEMSQLGHLAREWSEFLKFLEESLIGDSNGMINSSSLFYEVLPSNASVSVLNLMMRRLEEKMAGNKVSACTR